MTDKQNANPTTENESSAPNDNTAARVTDQEAVRKIIEQYIDKADLEISQYGGFSVWHPAWRDDDWKSEANSLEEITTMLRVKLKAVTSLFSYIAFQSREQQVL